LFWIYVSHVRITVRNAFKEFEKIIAKVKQNMQRIPLISEISRCGLNVPRIHEWFEVEFLGREPIGTGKIYNTRQIESSRS